METWPGRTDSGFRIILEHGAKTLCGQFSKHATIWRGDIVARYLVTGGCGFIGSNIVEHLVQAGQEVRVLDNLLTGRRENLSGFEDKVDFLHGDLLDPGTLA